MHIGSSWIRRRPELTWKSFVKFSRFVPDFTIKPLLNLLRKKNWLHLSRNLVTLASASLGKQQDLIDSGNHELKSCGVCTTRRMLTMLESTAGNTLSHTIAIKPEIKDSDLLKRSIWPHLRFTKFTHSHFISKDKNHHNQETTGINSLHNSLLTPILDVKDYKYYKTYYDFATRKATPKKAKKFKKVVSSSRKLSHILEKVLAEKPKRAKKPTKKSTTVPTTSVAIRDTPTAQLKKTLKKSKLGTHKLHASGLGDRVGSQLKVPDEQEDKTTGTDKGTAKPGVPGVPKYLTKSKNESWGDNDDVDDNDDDSDEVTKDDDEDDVESDADDDKEASDTKKMDSDEDEDLNLN
ncbi:hypothetical protein Tco_0247369 [Tanacetum coccineum]